MASLGDVALFSQQERYDSAAAFELVERPKQAVQQEYQGTIVAASPGSAYVVARFNGALSGEDAWERGHEIAQRGLDMMSILGMDDLLTHGTGEEYVVAWSHAARLRVRIHTTTTFAFDVPPVNLVQKDREGNVIPSNPPAPKHHVAFRYFRLSQASEDLYDAFRHMYLAFELLLSAAHPPNKGERERDWLERSLRAADRDLNIDRLYKDTHSDVVVRFIEDVYAQARLPLFHAKAGRQVVIPQASTGDRDRIRNALELLTRVVLAMAQTWHDARRMGGGVFFSWVYDNARSLLDGAQVLALEDSEPFAPDQEDLSHRRYLNAVELVSSVQDDPVIERAPMMLATAEGDDLVSLSRLTKVEIVKNDSPLMAHILESPLTLSGIDALEWRGATTVENVRQPRARFGR